MENLISLCVYKDTTGWYDDAYFEDWSHDNLIELEFPVTIVKRWFMRNGGYRVKGKRIPFWQWFTEESTADDTDGLFGYAVRHGFIPKKPDNYLENWG